MNTLSSSFFPDVDDWEVRDDGGRTWNHIGRKVWYAIYARGNRFRWATGSDANPKVVEESTDSFDSIREAFKALCALHDFRVAVDHLKRTKTLRQQFDDEQWNEIVQAAEE